MSIVNDIVYVILYLLPDFITLSIYTYYYPAKKQSDFIVAIWSLFYGLINYVLVRSIDESIELIHLSEYDLSIPSIELTIALILSAILLGFIRIWINKVIDRVKIFKYPDIKSSWNYVNQQIYLKHEKEKEDNWAYVYLNDGSLYSGWISAYTYDPDKKNQDFLLTKAARLDNKFNPIYKVSGLGVYIETRNVNRIEFFRKYP